MLWQATWKVAKQAYKDYRQLGRKLRFRVHVVPFVMNLLRKPVTKYLGDVSSRSAAVQRVRPAHVLARAHARNTCLQAWHGAMRRSAHVCTCTHRDMPIADGLDREHVEGCERSGRCAFSALL